jgi:hypothetical protein
MRNNDITCRLEVVMALSMKRAVFCEVMAYGLVEAHQRVRGANFLHLLGRRVGKASS